MLTNQPPESQPDPLKLYICSYCGLTTSRIASTVKKHWKPRAGSDSKVLEPHDWRVFLVAKPDMENLEAANQD